jgi:hypothetical protein
VEERTMKIEDKLMDEYANALTPEEKDAIVFQLYQLIRGLTERVRFLDALEAVGVNNWHGYSNAYEVLEEWENDTISDTRRGT